MPERTDTLPGDPTQPYTPTFQTDEFEALSAVVEQVPSEPLPVPAHPVVVPGNYQYLKRWQFVLVVAGVWALSAAAGWGLYHWWYHSIDKTAPVFVVLVFVITSTVGGLLLAMAPNRPVVTALAIAVMSAPLGAVAGAAVLHGLYYCEWASRCFVGLIPY
ncbi:hypothetical protein [Mycobacterium sp. IS-3022]|uniref:hypothetical protein n=1 Tax=Mycobacterium sp. IS-3022 TaxID=1772277 RepID=UPI000741569A|nr:hypothetical protein [Mycobacterium sp. IS-3022]KUH97199.1 hypothetical protein AU188_20995 [Mycobacterium sp. IS-3022]KUH97485.1 hypothetical protein AU188_22695 [Mycobacterium sp. IS-3022]